MGVLWPLTPCPSIPTADKLFGKRLLQAGRYIMSHKAWMKTVPTENCDVLMTFPGTETLGVPGAATPACGMWIVARGEGWGLEWAVLGDRDTLTVTLQTPPMTTRCSGS